MKGVTLPITIPEGYLPDARGRLVPMHLIDAYDQARDQLVRGIVADGERLAREIAEFIARTHADIDAFAELAHERYGVRMGGVKGNITLTSFDGRFRVYRAVQARIGFDERLQVAKELVNNCLQRWAKDSHQHLVTLVKEAFEADSEGNISTSKILALRRYKIDDPEWKKAMDIIADSIMDLASKHYIRLYERKELDGKYELMPLSVAGF